MHYPPAEREDLTMTLHGVSWQDPYRWLEDPDDPRGVNWLAAQQALGDDYLAGLAARPWFERRVREQFATGMVTLPASRGRRQFMQRRDPDQELLALWFRDGDDDWRQLLDPMTYDPAGALILDGFVPSPDGERVAVLLSRGGDEASRLHVLDVDSGKELIEPLDRCHALYTSPSWLGDGRGLVLSRIDGPAERRTWRLFRHAFDGAETQLSPDTDDVAEVWDSAVSPDGRWLLAQRLNMLPGTPVDLLVGDLVGDTPLRTLLAAGGAERHASWGPDNRLYVRSLDAPRGRILRLDPAGAGEPVELIPEHPAGLLLRQFAVTENLLVVNWADHNETSTLTVHPLAGGPATSGITLPGPGNLAGPVADATDPLRLWMAYGDFLTPQSVWTWCEGDEAITLWMARPGSLDTSDLETVSLEIPSHDGVLVPAIAIRRRGLTGPVPTALYAYGGFGFSLLRPAFDVWGAAWAAAGGCYVIVGCRGGGERGEEWHRAGMRENKPNTMLDLLAAAGWLVDQGWTTREQLGAGGLSNGGLTMAAAINRDPSAFAAVVCCAMHGDNLRALHEHGVFVEEYGDGNVAEEFTWLFRDSPYQQTLPGRAYPATLICAFGNDTRTVPSEGHKHTALMQWAQAGEAPIVLRHEQDAGHSTRTVEQMVSLLTDWLAFLAEHTGLRP